MIRPPELSKRRRNIVYAVSALVWITGAVWLLNQRPLWMKLHGAAAMAFLILFGSLWPSHFQPGWRLKGHRPAGAFIVGACAFLIFTGWMLYYCGDDAVRSWTSKTHSWLGLALPVLLYHHVWATRKPRY